jgi:uncharacterized protein YuzE
MAIRAEYDEAADALYLWLSDEAVARTEDKEGQGYAVDLTEAGDVVGIEILNAVQAPSLHDLAREWGFEDRVSEARAAMTAALPLRTYAMNAIQATTSMVVMGGATISSFGGGVRGPSQSISLGDPSRQLREAEPV